MQAFSCSWHATRHWTSYLVPRLLPAAPTACPNLGTLGCSLQQTVQITDNMKSNNVRSLSGSPDIHEGELIV